MTVPNGVEVIAQLTQNYPKFIGGRGTVLSSRSKHHRLPAVRVLDADSPLRFPATDHRLRGDAGVRAQAVFETVPLGATPRSRWWASRTWTAPPTPSVRWCRPERAQPS